MMWYNHNNYMAKGTVASKNIAKVAYSIQSITLWIGLTNASKHANKAALLAVMQKLTSRSSHLLGAASFACPLAA